MGIDGLTGVAPTLQIARERLEQPAELLFVVECRNYLVAAFMTLRIVSIPSHDVAPNGVIIRVHGRHPTIVRRSRRCRPIVMPAGRDLAFPPRSREWTTSPLPATVASSGW